MHPGISNSIPQYFGTVDQSVVKSLLKVENLQRHPFLMTMKPEGLTIKKAVVLAEILKNKSIGFK